MKASMVKDADIVRNYDAAGVCSIELLPGVYDGPMRAFKYYLKPGSSVSPQQYADKAVVFIFGKGTGYICGCDGGFSIDRLCFYAPNYDKSLYTIHAVSDLEFVMCVCDMNEYDFERAAECSVHLPFSAILTSAIPMNNTANLKEPNPVQFYLAIAVDWARLPLAIVVVRNLAQLRRDIVKCISSTMPSGKTVTFYALLKV